MSEKLVVKETPEREERFRRKREAQQDDFVSGFAELLENNQAGIVNDIEVFKTLKDLPTKEDFVESAESDLESMMKGR